ncbi:MAG: ATP-dependent RecD-like DNA helicase [Chloroflexi bacterium]|nr:ATP-dependent RecD-like DNA helicase [Chloroflexota bacterium]
MQSLAGSVVRITYYNEENGYSVLRLLPDEESPSQDNEGLVTVTGNLPEVAPGEYLSLSGEWAQHPKYGVQFQVERLEQARPATLEGIRRYLGSGLLKGIGPSIAENIVSRFGLETIDIIEKQPGRLREVPDIGPKRSKQIIAAWEEQRQIREVMLFLHSYGVSSNLATKIIKQYGDKAMQVVQRDPYQLARDIYGVGFKTADGIAQSLGLPNDHPTRLEAGLVHLINEFTGEGHVYAPQKELVARAVELLAVSPPLLHEGLERLISGGQIIVETDSNEGQAVYPRLLYEAEVNLAAGLLGLANSKESKIGVLPSLELLGLEARLSHEQLLAVRTALKSPVCVLTGGPGTGKTTTVKALIAALEAGGKRYALASPTGRAAKRLSQATDRPASTLHRLLGFSPNEGAKFNQQSPLPLDFLVVDEASMLDLQLGQVLIEALEPGSHLLLVGDVDQLPSVGAGDVLREIIASGLVPVVRLSTIYRQSEESHIIENAHRINKGEIPKFSPQSEDFFLFPAENAEQAAQWVADLVSTRIPERFGVDPLKDIQVMAPIYRGPAGVTTLNAELQEALNPANGSKVERSFFGQVLRVGDKIMQLKNNYDKSVFNGDIGQLRNISNEDQSLSVEFEGRIVDYDWSEADELTLAYAISVHKSQGSEFPVIVLPVLTQHYIMLQRNLIYTAITRAKEICVLVGSKRAIAIAVKNNRVAERWSKLAERLSNAKQP